MTTAHLVSASGLSFRQAATDHPLQQQLAEWWKGWAVDRPHLFNGSLVAVQSCEALADGGIEITWFQSSYAHYMQRAASSPVSEPARALFCSLALLSTSGALVVGQMSNRTSSPGRFQLPGGNVDPDATGRISLAHCANEARREFAEETGLAIDTVPVDLWRIKTGGAHNDVGLMFLCRSSITDGDILRGFEAYQRASQARGASPEFSRIVLVRPPNFLVGEIATCVDYLPSVIALLARSVA